jgi:ATP-dependent Clp protease ATP-binding subunit ClpA
VIHEQAALSYLDERAKQVIGAARESAVAHRCEAIDPAHLLLGLLAVRRGMAARAVAAIAGSLAVAESAIAGTVSSGRRPSPSHVPLTAAAEEAIARAGAEARRCGDDRIGTEHLLLGLLAGTGNAAVRRLSDVGVDDDGARIEIDRLRADG